MDLTRFLTIATRLSSTLADLHEGGIVHQNVRPQNIVVGAESDDVTLTGFVADRDALLMQREAPGSRLEAAALPYMSPEQTGRMNRPVDYRTDFYSLGVTLYEMLSGGLPFNAADPLGWVHCHIARPPQPLFEAAPGTPRVVSDIVMKLMAKVAEERYQSARGLELDLKRCLAELEDMGRIEPFVLASRDISNKLQIPAKLYGRTDECRRLLTAFDRVVASGTPELMLVSGYSGIGKTSVVQEVHKPIVRERGFFIAGKFEQYKRDVPYLTLGLAFRELVVQLLSESDAKLEEWKRHLIDALAANGQLVVDLIPQLELIIGKQPPVPPLSGTEGQNRFNTVWNSFIGVFARREHPLALFLDDLQWADLASLRLLQHVLSQEGTRHLFVLGAYRDNEVSPSHPLVATLEDIRKAGARVTTVTLGPLSLEHLTDLLTDTFHAPVERTGALAQLLRSKTDGNPFFVTQFLAELHQERLVRFDRSESTWQWSLAEIQAKNFTDNIVELMVGKLMRLAPETQNAMKLAACIGNQIEIELLALIHQKTVAETHHDLREVAREGLMLPRGSKYKFLHDRVQQAAYTLIPEDQRSGVHLQIGRLLLARTPEAEVDGKLFDIVNQLKLGASLVETPAEKIRLADLSLRAGRKAKASAAYASAASYFMVGVSMLSEASWETDYDLALGLHVDLAECQCLSGAFDETERLCAIVLEHARTALEKVEAYRVKVQMCTVKGDNAKSIEAGLACLHMLGIDLPEKRDDEVVLDGIRGVLADLGDRSIEALIDLPAMTDPAMSAAMPMLSGIIASAYYTDPNLTVLIMCRMVSLSISHGNSAASAAGYTFFGKVLCDKLSKYEDGYRFGKLAYELTEKQGLISFKAEVCNTLACSISIWSRHFKEYEHYARIGIQAALDVSNATWGSLNHIQTVQAMLMKEDDLEAIYKASVAAVDFVTRANMMFVADALTGIQRFVQNMRGLTEDFTTFNGDGFDQTAFETRIRDGIPLVRFWNLLMKLQARVHSGNHAEAVALTAAAKELAWAGIGMVLEPEFVYYSALAAAGHFKEATEEQRAGHRTLLAEHQAKLAVWAKSGPDNYACRHALVSAEIARLEGRNHEAAELYDRAMTTARASAFLRCEALSNELAASFYLERGFASLPEFHLQQARACYARWGAFGKVRQLERLHPEILRDAREADSRLQPALGSGESLDTNTAVRASFALSSSMDPHQLMATLMRIVIEHAGAQRCCLLVPIGEDMALAAEGTANRQGIDVHIPEPGSVPDVSSLPRSLINYVRRTREKVFISDGMLADRFASDEYLAREQPRSALCVPIVRNVTVIGIIYLENKLTRGAFTARRLPLIEFLAAITLQNTTLYTELAQENAERKHAEKTLRRSENRIRRLMETANVIPWQADSATGRFVYVGPQVERILGYPEAEWYRENFLRLHLHPDDLEHTTRRIRAAGAQEQHDEFDFRILAADGRVVWFHNVVGTSDQDDEGGSKVIGGFLFDATERKQTESTLLEKLEIIQKQQEEIRTLSTPVIEVWEGVLTMPVFGSIDEHRATQMMDVLLNAVTRTRCRYIIVDVTGVDRVDMSTANHIIRLVQAVKLLGSQGIVVGIRPEVAQTIVSLGVDLSSVVTLANLREALVLCMRATNARAR